MGRYFAKRKWFREWLRQNKGLFDWKWACSFCPSQKDTHWMNCHERCPLEQVGIEWKEG